MEAITFRPLRIVKKSGKIVVASYQQWRRIKTADSRGLILGIIDDYKQFPQDAKVYNHKGEHLFWRDYNPALIEEIPPLQTASGYERPWVTDYGMYSADGLDCSGVPAFSHYSAVSIANQYGDMSDFEPLTVGMVANWLGWFLYELKNTEILWKLPPSTSGQ